MKDTIKHDVERVDFWLNEISKNNDMVVKTTEDLRIILLNLKIVGAWIDKTIGLNPVIDSLERLIKQQHDSIQDMVKNGRTELRASWTDIKEELNQD